MDDTQRALSNILLARIIEARLDLLLAAGVVPIFDPQSTNAKRVF